MNLQKLYNHIDKVCLVMIDRSMWFAKSYEALAEDDFAPLVRKHSQLAGKEEKLREPVTFAFSYAQRVFLCSAMELCLMHQYANSVGLLEQFRPSDVRRLDHLLPELKRHKVKTWDQWEHLEWAVRREQLGQLSFSNLSAAAKLFDDIYGARCFDRAWGNLEHERLAREYGEYQTLRNGIIHRGGELSSGTRIEATEADIVEAFQAAERFRDAIRALSRWCRIWWTERLSSPEILA